MDEPLIRVEGIGKRYKIGLRQRKTDSFREAVVEALRSPFRRLQRLRHPSAGGEDTFWALKDINFEVRQGEVVGIIGRNGAGKSTLLKILSRITEPTVGRVTIHGRVGSLLEVGTGFHPELTGRENVYLNGAILGMHRGEIESKFDEIVEFSGVERFLDTPVKRYSSGMRVRLGFAVAAHLDPEILIVDEVLAVGDVQFQKKCLGKMQNVASSGRTVLFVSHNMAAIRNLCSRAILLRTGEIGTEGETAEVVSEYLTSLDPVGDSGLYDDNPERSGSGDVRFTDVDISGESEAGGGEIVAGRDATITFDYENRVGAPDARVFFTIFNRDGVAVTHCDPAIDGPGRIPLAERGAVACRFRRLPLIPGRYRVAACIEVDGVVTDLLPNIICFDVTSTVYYPSGRHPNPQYCAVLTDHEWVVRQPGEVHGSAP